MNSKIVKAFHTTIHQHISKVNKIQNTSIIDTLFIKFAKLSHSTRLEHTPCELAGIVKCDISLMLRIQFNFYLKSVNIHTCSR